MLSYALSVIKGQLRLFQQSLLSRIEICRGFARTTGAARSCKMVVNGMADCFSILKRTTRLKCVNSEVRLSAFSQMESLHWVHAPCGSHHGNHIELDHWSDPMGTESHKNWTEPYVYIYINMLYIYIWYIYTYIDRTTVATSCDLNAPRCTTEVLRVRFHGYGGSVYVGHRPPETPVPLQYMKKEV